MELIPCERDVEYNHYIRYYLLFFPLIRVDEIFIVDREKTHAPHLISFHIFPLFSIQPKSRKHPFSLHFSFPPQPIRPLKKIGFFFGKLQYKPYSLGLLTKQIL